MNRCLIFCASLLLTFVTISSVCGASTADWHRAALDARAAAPFGGTRASASFGGGWMSVTPSRLVSIDVIRL